MKNVRRKKSKLVRYKVCDDCKECRQNLLKEMPLVKDLGDFEKFKELSLHLYHTKNSLPYLLKMTTMGGNEIVRLFAETGNVELSRLMGEYFGDVEQILKMVIEMKKTVGSDENTIRDEKI